MMEVFVLVVAPFWVGYVSGILVTRFIELHLSNKAAEGQDDYSV